MRITQCGNKLAFCSLIYLFSTPLFATGHNYMGISLGSSFAKLSNASPQIAYESGALITDDYPLNKTQVSSLLVSMNGGYEFIVLNNLPAIALGLGLYVTPRGYNYHGQLFETAEGDPGSTLYNYTYNIFSTRLMAEAQFTWDMGKCSPFINLGIGSALNRMNSYKEDAVESTGFPAVSPFKSKTNANFAYQAGFGISRSFNLPGHDSNIRHERLAVGYRYANSGKTSFGIRDAFYPYQLNSGTLTTNDIYISFTHLI